MSTTATHARNSPATPERGALADTARRRWLNGLCGLGAATLAVLATGCGSAPPRTPDTGDSGNPFPRASEPAPDHAQAVTLHALGLVGTPYRYGGNTPESGFDCSGLIAYVYWHAARIQTPRTTQQLGGWGQSVPQAELRTGDLVVFSSRGRANHAGIYVGEGRFVHAPSTGGTVRLDHLGSAYWSRQARSYRRAD